MSVKLPFELEKITADEYILNMGPQHPSTHGVLRIALKLDGETIKDIYPDVGYIHSSVEKMCENKKYEMIRSEERRGGKEC